MVGHSEPAGALTAALLEQGIAAELYAPARASSDRGVGTLASSLLELEKRLSEPRSDLAVAVGLGDAALAAAIVAAKLRIPLVAWVEGSGGANGELELAERRILDQLADLDAGPVGDGPAAIEAARAIAEWAAAPASG